MGWRDPGILGSWDWFFSVRVYFLMKLNSKDPKDKDFLDLMCVVSIFW